MHLSKKEYIQSLMARNLFWSYEGADASSMPDDVLIEHVLGYGEPEDIVRLRLYFPLSHIRRVWQQRLLPDVRMIKANVWLAKVFFNVIRVDKYIEKYARQNNRYNHLRFLAAQN